MTVAAPADFVAKQVIDVIGSKLVRRGIDLAAVPVGRSRSGRGQSVRQKATIVEGIEKDVASKINKDIKAEKFKVKVQIEGDKLRVSSSLARCAAGGHRLPQGEGLRPAAPVRQLPLGRSRHMESSSDAALVAPCVAFVTLGCAKNEADTGAHARAVGGGPGF